MWDYKKERRMKETISKPSLKPTFSPFSIAFAARMSDCLPPVYRHLKYFTTSISIFVGILIIYLIVFRTPRELKTYSRVLICPAIVDLLYATISFIIGLVGFLLAFRRT